MGVQLLFKLTYLLITTCCRSWPQLNYDAIHHELLQLGANLWYPALSAKPSFSATSTTGLRFEDFTNWLGAIHTSGISTLYFNSYTTSMSSYISCSSWFHRMRHFPISQKGAFVLRRIFLSKTFPHLKMPPSRSLHHIIRPSIWATYICKSSFSKRGLFCSIAFLAQCDIY